MTTERIIDLWYLCIYRLLLSLRLVPVANSQISLLSLHPYSPCRHTYLSSGFVAVDQCLRFRIWYHTVISLSFLPPISEGLVHWISYFTFFPSCPIVYIPSIHTNSQSVSFFTFWLFYIIHACPPFCDVVVGCSLLIHASRCVSCSLLLFKCLHMTSYVVSVSRYYSSSTLNIENQYWH